MEFEKVTKDINNKIQHYVWLNEMWEKKYMFIKIKEFVQNKVNNNKNITINDFEHELFEKIDSVYKDKYYSWILCSHNAKIKDETYCHICYNSQEEHKDEHICYNLHVSGNKDLDPCLYCRNYDVWNNTESDESEEDEEV